MAKKPEITKSDKLTFRQAMGQIKPIKHTKIPLEPLKTHHNNHNKLKKQVFYNDEEDNSPSADYFSDFEKMPSVGGEDILQFARSGIQNKILRNLRNGKYNVEAILDLHGKTVEEARNALTEFLLKCQEHGVRHVLIIHGKGRHTKVPILKNKLNNWLRETNRVLAFCSATTRDGRGGSLYVLLKKISSAEI